MNKITTKEPHDVYVRTNGLDERANKTKIIVHKSFAAHKAALR